MATEEVFQLTVISQNDPECPIGSQLTCTVTGYEGGSLQSNSFPVDQPVPLPVPPPPPPPPSPTWFLTLDDGIEKAQFTVVIEGPGTKNPTQITVHGRDLPKWVEQNKKEKTNQIYKEARCGIFGYAQRNHVKGQPFFWIYTLTAGVFEPKVHPGG